MKLLVVRGDMQSQSGYSAAARDLSRLAKGLFDKVVGVDLHYAKDRPFEAFPYPLLTEDEARRLSERMDFTLVLTYTTPPYFTRYPGAASVGLTAWETDRLPGQDAEKCSWVTAINKMDAAWVNSSRTRAAFEAAGATVPVRVVPWPVRAAPVADPGLPPGKVYNLDRRPWLGQPLVELARVRGNRYGWSRQLMAWIGPRAVREVLRSFRTSPRRIEHPSQKALVCVAQDVPRKGLLLFLSEWLQFKRRPEGNAWSLILKTTSIDPRTTEFDLVYRFWSHVQVLKRQLHVGRAGVYIWTGNLDATDFNRLLANTQGSIAPSLGEGFCGPAAQALALGKALVAPRHTAFADYIAEDHPYAFATRPVILSFVNDPLPGVYDPASTWNVPLPFALADALSRFAKDTPESRALAGRRGQNQIERHCGPDRVRHILADEVRRLEALTARRSAA
jgi:glycosyltransferase involved in cell wall biosynthesis